MSRVYFTSDWHFGHHGITDNFRTQFGSLHQMEEYIWHRAESRLTKNDLTIMVGDMSFSVEGLERINELPGRKILVRGNHDIFPMEHYTNVFEQVHGAMEYKGAFVTHIPIHPMELYRKPNIHGHCHRGGPAELEVGDDWQSYYNVIVEYNDYDLVSAEDIFAELKRRKRGTYVSS